MLPMTTEQAVLHGHCRVDHRTPPLGGRGPRPGLDDHLARHSDALRTYLRSRELNVELLLVEVSQQRIRNRDSSFCSTEVIGRYPLCR